MRVCIVVKRIHFIPITDTLASGPLGVVELG
jgi:hypothetical protein